MAPGREPGGNRRALIVGLNGPQLLAGERAFLSQFRPAGIILFDRNLRDHAQIRDLVARAREAIGGPALVLIDQEGGRVQRLRPPLGRALPPAAAYGRMMGDGDRAAAETAAWSAFRLVAHDMRALNINAVCAPVLDMPVPGAHDIIGDRAFGRHARDTAALGNAVARGLLDGGVLPVVKHIPGHGRARADSHLELPVVDTPLAELECTDFAAFRFMREMTPVPAAMTAHVVFSGIDAAQPASTSARVTAEVIRGSIGFDGLLMSDDLGMKALGGPMAARARAVIEAGSDVALECSGILGEMQAAAGAVPVLIGRAMERFTACLACVETVKPFDRADAEARLAAVMDSAVGA